MSTIHNLNMKSIEPLPLRRYITNNKSGNIELLKPTTKSLDNYYNNLLKFYQKKCVSL